MIEIYKITRNTPIISAHLWRIK